MDIPESLLIQMALLKLSVSPKDRGREGVRKIFRAEGAQETWVEKKRENENGQYAFCTCPNTKEHCFTISLHLFIYYVL